MKSDAAGKSTLTVEVTQIDKHGIWLLIGDEESFLPCENFPRFRAATIGAIHNVEMSRESHVYWRDLDIDLAVNLIQHPESFPVPQ